jgi:hypothetical protein
MAQIKIVVTIESTYVRDAHAAIDAADAYLRLHDGRVVHARLVPVQEVAREPEPEPEVSRCSSCGEPAHPSETDDYDRCEACRLTEAARGHVEDVLSMGVLTAADIAAQPDDIATEDWSTIDLDLDSIEDRRRLADAIRAAARTIRDAVADADSEDDIEECADCGASTADGTPSPHECAPPARCVACGEPRPVSATDDRCEACVIEASSDAERAEILTRGLKALPAYNGWAVAWEYPGYLAFHRPGSCSVLATPDYHERGLIAVEVRLANGIGLPVSDITWPREGRTPEGFMALLRPVLDKAAPLDGSDGAAIFEAEQDDDDEIECVSDAQANEQLVAALAALPAYNGWRAHWEYPGYVAFHRKGSPSIFATPDYHERGQISCEVEYSSGHQMPLDNAPWPRKGRTPEAYMAIMRHVLDKAAPLSDTSDEIFEDVMRAMQQAEELGGPEGAQYVALLERIAHEAQRRADTMRATLVRS